MAGGREQREGAERGGGCAAQPGSHPRCSAELAGAPVPEAGEADAVEAHPWQVHTPTLKRVMRHVGSSGNRASNQGLQRSALSLYKG